ncbi:hypothetical protein DPV79_40650 [Burkholderia reimsis]|uniref:Uncharacterized protein n=1 Tax=Burkholderia reimsis TaxID=2234132 RepID=A0A365QGD8_9BURK|nr:hypothetical protein DPV79_40650 [Burkholderia reimsis]
MLRTINGHFIDQSPLSRTLIANDPALCYGLHYNLGNLCLRNAHVRKLSTMLLDDVLEAGT